jgi:hypothetical protein
MTVSSNPQHGPAQIAEAGVMARPNPLTPDASQRGALEFLSRVLPWPESDEASGYCNIHWTFVPEDGDDPRWAGKPFRSVREALSFVKWLGTKPSTRDIYFCLSQQRERKPGKKPGQFAAVRKGENATLFKSLWLDIDVKTPPKGYENLPEAVKALTTFRKEVGLPPPSAVVKSGGGLHVYWISKSPLTPDRWKPLAEQLKNAAIEHGLRCDACCTVDAARILRVPQTWNCKTEPWRPVQLLLLGENHDF